MLQTAAWSPGSAAKSVDTDTSRQRSTSRPSATLFSRIQPAASDPAA
jgi:hypothetical protein